MKLAYQATSAGTLSWTFRTTRDCTYHQCAPNIRVALVVLHLNPSTLIVTDSPVIQQFQGE